MDNVPRSVPGTHFFTCAGSLSCSNEEGFSHFCGHEYKLILLSTVYVGLGSLKSYSISQYMHYL